ncbi:MAG: hypothetical protein DI535_17595 [Citrobacter freundii]|nr:MAG: hypothetical protein DI535_17595 [Citrobacter freundii]
MKVLWIVGWYPNQIEPFAGDFVQRHAQAVSIYQDVTVLFVTRDADRIVTNKTATIQKAEGRLKEKAIYYALDTKPAIFSKLNSLLKYQSLLKQEVKEYIAKNGKPDLIHFYINMRTNIIGKWIHKLGVPYVVSEQWTGFLKEGIPNFKNLPSLYRKGWISLMKNAAGVHVVSNYLGNALQQLTDTTLPLKLIPNVVNTAIFFPKRKEETEILKFAFVTSQLDYQKNTEDMFYALSLLKQKGKSFVLDVFGPLQEKYIALAVDLNISREVIVHGEKSQQELAGYFTQADALIIYSRFETFGCVIIEANACGTPVLASDIPVLHENITEGVNGVFAGSEDRRELAGRLEWLAENRSAFNREKIAAQTAAAYNYEKVGKMFADWYSQILTQTKG